MIKKLNWGHFCLKMTKTIIVLNFLSNRSIDSKLQPNSVTCFSLVLKSLANNRGADAGRKKRQT